MMNNIKDIKYSVDGATWTVTVNNKFEGKSFFVWLAMYKALMLAVTNNFEE